MSNLKKLYKQIWERRPHRCQVCGYPLRKPIANVFSHIYSKGAHPSLKYEPQNIQLWCATLIRLDDKFGCHDLWHSNPKAFWSRANANGWQKPELQQLKSQINQ